MNIQSIVKVLCACLAVVSFNVTAIPITVNDNINGTVLVSPSSPVNGQFDINPAIPTTGYYNTPYDVTSATATFVFTDDYDALSFTGSSTSSYYLDHRRVTDDNSTDYWYRNQINYYRNDSDAVSVTIENQVSTDGTNYYDLNNYYTGTNSNGGGYTGRYCDFSIIGICFDWDQYYDYYYTRSYTDEYGWRGDLTMSMIYGGDSLADLAEDGISNFSLSSACSVCDIYYLNGSLTANIEESVNVPEPPMILLLASGLIGFARLKKA